MTPARILVALALGMLITGLWAAPAGSQATIQNLDCSNAQAWDGCASLTA